MAKQRSKQEIENEYSNECAQCGHKYATIAALERQEKESDNKIALLRSEIQGHMSKMMKLRDEKWTPVAGTEAPTELATPEVQNEAS